MKRVLFVSGDTIGSNMGGVGVRNWELANALARNYEVSLAVPNELDLISEKLNLISIKLEETDLRPIAQGSDVIVTHGFVLHFHPYLAQMNIPIAIDLYVPSLLESLVWHDKDDWETWIPSYEEYLRVQLELLLIGDFFFCASERQRDYWLGWLHAQKRINPHTYNQDPTLRQLIDVVPFGLPSREPIKNSPVLKGIHPGIFENDQLILWSGGLWDWLDPLTLIHALSELATQYPDLKLYFMGTRHPNPIVQGMKMPDQAISLSQELGVYNKSVFFGDWVAYEDRVNYLLEADMAVITHPAHIETRFSNRTRVLDCIWTGLPIITTEGDAMADWVRDENLGITVPACDVQALSNAIIQLLTMGGRNEFKQSFASLRAQLSWDKVISPLANFCSSPSIATDKGKYLTELERYRRDAEKYLQQVIVDKDAFLEKVINDKDAYIEQVIADKDAVIEKYQKMLPVKIYQGIRKTISKS